MAIIAKESVPKSSLIIEVNVLESLGGLPRFTYRQYVETVEEMEIELTKAYGLIQDRYRNA